jgi:transposase
MRKIKDVLRLKLDAKLSHQQIATALGISKGVVTKYVGLAAAAGLDWSTVQALDEAALEQRLLVAPEQPRDHVQPDYGRLHQMLRGKGMTLMLLWEEHRADHADAQTYSYSQFCENYRRFAKQLKRSMRQIHRAGEKLFIDYAGPTIALRDGNRAHIFVAALGASSYTYACATPRETMVDWLESTAAALAFFGGVPQLIVPDNPKAMIADANRYEPRSNDTVLDFARHYGTSVLPARPRHPQDKAKAESAVQVVERWIMARLRHQRFASVQRSTRRSRRC